MSSIEINPTFIIISHWIEYIVLLSVFIIILKAVKPTGNFGKGIRLIFVILSAVSVAGIVSLFIDTVGYSSDKKEYPKYEVCEIKQITTFRNVIHTRILFTCKDGRKFTIDKWTLDLDKDLIFDGKGRLVSSYTFTDDEKAVGKFTILPVSKIIINVQPVENHY